MDINYIILAHKNPAQVERLVHTLSTEGTTFYIHIDKNTEQEPFERRLQAVKNCRFIETREKGTWGDVGIVQATIHALRQIVADQRSGYCVLLSGQDYPLKSNQHIAQYLTQNQGASFMDASALPNLHWDHGGLDRIEHYKFNLSEGRQDYVVVPPVLSKDFSRNWIYHVYNIKKLLQRRINIKVLLKKRSFPHYIRPVGGSQWWAIPVETAAQVLTFLEQHTDYLLYHRYTLLPDEIALQSIIRQLLHADGNELVQPTVTYINWERPGVTLPVTFDRNDLKELLNQPEDKLFARKFDAETDATILDLLDRRIVTTA
ncbi:hypothetical protein J0X19_21465 [Hymenobacter sp. BT186]|uniref:Peptide O-xylosyltransferase n=1 Tax=Hymenobacter telluris TaxID=2816474 RepID=A0A939F1U7_9BACT|nr:beta-1,6-N-acetylglucosaminyltransferase [Hymenobacter telluris]MBO0360545.1 hypothetical protein [Hymenobacter telluris]MBW3376572.1 beta-1,6-N-acetylglucosaminyltransferase [Hymenobacter norwichensis]